MSPEESIRKMLNENNSGPIKSNLDPYNVPPKVVNPPKFDKPPRRPSGEFLPPKTDPNKYKIKKGQYPDMNRNPIQTNTGGHMKENPPKTMGESAQSSRLYVIKEALKSVLNEYGSYDVRKPEIEVPQGQRILKLMTRFNQGKLKTGDNVSRTQAAERIAAMAGSRGIDVRGRASEGPRGPVINVERLPSGDETKYRGTGEGSIGVLDRPLHGLDPHGDGFPGHQRSGTVFAHDDKSFNITVGNPDLGREPRAVPSAQRRGEVSMGMGPGGGLENPSLRAQYAAKGTAMGKAARAARPKNLRKA